MNRAACVSSLSLLAAYSAFAQEPAAPSRAAPQPALAEPPADELPLAVAYEWAQAAVDACKANGYSVAAAYMNNTFGIKVMLRADGARSGLVETARRKAYTVIKSGMSSADFATSVGMPPGSPRPPAAPGAPPGMPPGPNPDPNMIIAAGGLPVKSAGKIVGAVSVSGAPGPGGAKDVECAEAGLVNIASKLK